MCGIVGFVGHPAGEVELRRAVAALHHRGPDGSGVFLHETGPVGLGHARLAIMDLSPCGAQPLYSEARDLVVVCNGEIYEYERLRGELEGRGHVFCSHSDTELILHFYQEYGPEFVEHLRGEFAFLLYDRQKEILLAVRDRFGIKPLYFNDQGGKLLFASEAKAMFATGLLKPRINPVAIRDYLSGALPDSIFEGVDVVPPGRMMIVDVKAQTHELREYWDLGLGSVKSEDEITEPERAMEVVRRALEEAVQHRLRADVPVGVYLSGGIDSATVAALAAQHHAGRIKAFSICFPDDAAFNELDLARNMARHIGAEFHSVTCDFDTLLRHVEDFLWVVELPFFNFHGVGKFLLSRLARQHVKVVLTGEGSDEVFLGYVYFQPGKGWMYDQMSNRLRAKRPPRKRLVDAVVRELGFLPVYELATVLTNRSQRTLAWCFHPQHWRRLLATDPFERFKRRLDRSKTGGLPHVRQIQYFSIKSLLAPYILAALGDRAELGHSVEGRPPFLDHRLFEQVRHISDDLKIRDGVEKHVLREAFRGRLTPEIAARKKWPYFAPPMRMVKGWNRELDRLMDEYLSGAAVRKCGLFRGGAMRVLRWLRNVQIVESRLSRTLDTLLAFALTVQILDRLYVQSFDESLRKRAPAT
jgi:asparagine synthase (glutamine-hydrolysing)